jgi:hypothetical protein
MIAIFLKLQDNIPGPNLLTKNLVEVLRMLRVKLEPLNLGQITLVPSTMEKSMSLEDMGVSDILDNPSMIYTS